jgi:hypothetical protein
MRKPKPRAKEVRKPPPAIRATPKAVSAILEDLEKLSDDDLGLFFWALSEGCWDEWDTGLVGCLEIMGEKEMRVAIHSAVYAAKAVENVNESVTKDQ